MMMFDVPLCARLDLTSVDEALATLTARARAASAPASAPPATGGRAGKSEEAAAADADVYTDVYDVYGLLLMDAADRGGGGTIGSYEVRVSVTTAREPV